MIIKNNFNTKSMDPLKGYKEVGKGSNSTDRKMEMEKEGFIPENMNNKVLQDLKDKDSEYNDDDNDNGSRWDFFR